MKKVIIILRLNLLMMKMNNKQQAIDQALKKLTCNDQHFKNFYNDLMIKGSNDENFIEALEYMLPYLDYSQKSMMNIWRYAFNKKYSKEEEQYLKRIMKDLSDNYYKLMDYLNKKK